MADDDLKARFEKDCRRSFDDVEAPKMPWCVACFHGNCTDDDCPMKDGWRCVEWGTKQPETHKAYIEKISQWYAHAKALARELDNLADFISVENFEEHKDAVIGVLRAFYDEEPPEAWARMQEALEKAKELARRAESYMPKGVFRKYVIHKADGSPCDPEACYFVLRLDKDEAARAAARTYAEKTENRQLAGKIIACVDELEAWGKCGCREANCPHVPMFSAVWRYEE